MFCPPSSHAAGPISSTSTALPSIMECANWSRAFRKNTSQRLIFSQQARHSWAQGRGCHRSCRSRWTAVVLQALTSREAYRLLGAEQGCSRAELRSAYLLRIRQVPCHSLGDVIITSTNQFALQHCLWLLTAENAFESSRYSVQLHPDVNPQKNTTEAAVALNEAYALLQQVCKPR